MKVSLSKNQIDSLKDELEEKVKGEVRFGDDYRALYATDASNYRQVPVGVVFPQDKEDIIITVELCQRYGLHLLTRGGGTSLAGQCCNSGLVMDFSKHYNKILEIDPDKKQVRVQTGLVLDDLNRALKEHGLIFGPDPATHNHCTLGGMVGNNSCGIHSVMAQMEDGGIRTCDFVESMEVLTYDGHVFEVGATSPEELETITGQGDRKGEIYQNLKKLRDDYSDDIKKGIPDIPRRVSGYNLDELLPEKGFNVARALSGTESTCVVYLEVTLRLITEPKERSLLVLGYDTVFDCGDHVPEIMKHRPVGLEGMDKKLITYMHKRHLHEQYLSLLPKGDGWLLVEFGADSKEASDQKAKDLMKELKKNANGDAPEMQLYDDPGIEEHIWAIREAGLGATAFVEGLPDMWPGWEDSAVPPDKVGDYLKDLRKLFQKYDYHPSLYGHFGQGCIHCRVGFDLKTHDGIENYKSFTDEAADLVVGYGGSLSGEHGDGQARGALLHRMYGNRLMEAFHRFKKIWDPEWKMNPGKIIAPMARDENLRLGTDFRPSNPDTYFKYPEDQDNFHRAAMRCVGVGECRKTHTGTMCPSYMVTLDEKDVTRGRAHLLFEMMNGKEIKNGWKNDHVKESLDLCLACKGCLGECPVHVDMATYKAEYFGHYYKGKIRPRSAYAFGLIDQWASMATNIPSIVNFISSSQFLSPLFKWAGGIAPERKVPQFAKESFTKSRRNKEASKRSDSTVMLWPDTFNNYFFPEVLEAGEKVLKSGGYDVIVPYKKFCCGRALYDFGMLERAKSYLMDILDNLSDYIQTGVPFVGMEPSCIAVFRNELGNLFPHDNNAQRLQNNFYTLPEFIMAHEDRFAFHSLHTSGLLQRHCHHQAVMKYDADRKVFDKIGVDLNVPDSGCCGLAGSYGFERGKKYNISMKAGERRIFPAVQEMDEELLIADGFSCREQIRHGTGKMPEHIAQVLERAIGNP